MKMSRTHLWTFVFLWTADWGASQNTPVKNSTLTSTVTALYPSIGGSVTLNCECPDHQCQKVYWYRLLRGNDTPQFLVYCNNANSKQHGAGINSGRFKADTNDLSKIMYSLRITDIQQDEAGFYSCLMSSQKQGDPKDMMPRGYYIRPGEHPPTPPPVVKATNPKKPRSYQSNCQPHKGCRPLVLWPSVGVLLALGVALISTLYYFSRLPKKCRHHFAKKMQL